MNYYAPYQQQGYDPSSQTQQFYDQTTNSYYSYAYSNPQYPTVHPYTYPNVTVQPSQHEEQEPNPPGVTPPTQPELGMASYYPPSVGPPQQVALDTAVAGVHPPNVQSSYSSVGFINGIAPGSYTQNHVGPNPNVSHQPYHVHGGGSVSAMQMNAAVAHSQNQAVIVPGGPPQPLSQSYQPLSHSYAESHLTHGQNIPGRPYRVSGSGRGRGRGRGRGKGRAATPAQSAASSLSQIPLPIQAPVQSAPGLPPPKAVCCEICRVECNTIEILKQHMNGKKHKKKLKVFQESQNLNITVPVSQTEQMPISELKPEISSQPVQIEVPVNQPLQQENLPSQAINEETQVAVEEQKLVVVETGEESVKKVRMDRTGGGRGLKRKMRGGKVVGRRTKPFDGSKKVAPAKPKEINIPLVCELCNVKCESNVVFQSHLVGKKHLAKAKRFQETLGQQLVHPQAPIMQVVGQHNASASTYIVSQVQDQAPVLTTVTQPE